MNKIIVLGLILIMNIQQANAYAIKIYNEYGERIGTAQKNGENYVLYDMDGNKVENYEGLVSSTPFAQTTPSGTPRFLYDEFYIPLGYYHNGCLNFYPNQGLRRRPTIIQRYPYPRNMRVNYIKTGFGY